MSDPNRTQALSSDPNRTQLGVAPTLDPNKTVMVRIVNDNLPELSYAKVAFTSAKESAGLEPVLDAVIQAVENYSFRLSTGQLNRLIQDALFSRPYTSKGKVLKIYYATQVITRPPTFALFCNDPDLLHFSYERYLMNKIREAFPLEGTPIKISARHSHKRDEK